MTPPVSGNLNANKPVNDYQNKDPFSFSCTDSTSVMPSNWSIKSEEIDIPNDHEIKNELNQNVKTQTGMITSKFAIPNMPSHSQKQTFTVKKMSDSFNKKQDLIEQTPKPTMISNINIKIEEVDLPKKRKKICRKMYSIFSEEFNIDKRDAKK